MNLWLVISIPILWSLNKKLMIFHIKYYAMPHQKHHHYHHQVLVPCYILYSDWLNLFSILTRYNIKYVHLFNAETYFKTPSPDDFKNHQNILINPPKATQEVASSSTFIVISLFVRVLGTTLTVVAAYYKIWYISKYRLTYREDHT